jgi:hypothetical protein
VSIGFASYIAANSYDFEQVRPRIPDEKRLSRAFQALLFGNRLMFHVVDTLRPDIAF